MKSRALWEALTPATVAFFDCNQCVTRVTPIIPFWDFCKHSNIIIQNYQYCLSWKWSLVNQNEMHVTSHKQKPDTSPCTISLQQHEKEVGGVPLYRVQLQSSQRHRCLNSSNIGPVQKSQLSSHSSYRRMAHSKWSNASLDPQIV